MKAYHGWRDTNGDAHVVVIDTNIRSGKELPLRLDLSNHSPDGFEWGYGGSGPAQLALALLADALADDALAVKLHQDFKWKHITTIAQDCPAWHMTVQEVRDAAAALREPVS